MYSSLTLKVKIIYVRVWTSVIHQNILNKYRVHNWKIDYRFIIWTWNIILWIKLIKRHFYCFIYSNERNQWYYDKKKTWCIFSHEMNSTYADKVEYFTTIVRGVTSCCWQAHVAVWFISPSVSRYKLLDIKIIMKINECTS